MKSKSKSIADSLRHKDRRVYHLRPCPQCGQSIFGIPGGVDAICQNCGYKDPCCGD